MPSSTSLNTESTSQQPRRSWRLKPTVRRQARLELDVPTTSYQTAPSVSPSRDHGLRTPPGPPSMTSSASPLRPRRPTTLDADEDHVLRSHRHATHMMASDISGLLAPPSRSIALNRAHTDPSSSSNYEVTIPQEATPNSPPPTYEEVMKQVRYVLGRNMSHFKHAWMLIPPAMSNGNLSFPKSWYLSS